MKQRYVLLLARDESYLVAVEDRKINTNSGIIDLGKLKKKRIGQKIRTHLGKEFVIAKPTLIDFMNKKLKRLPQIVMPKDAAMILAYTGIPTNAKVVDAGTGSGFMAIFLGYYLKDGKIVSYEKRKEFANIARENIKILGLKNVKIKNKDILHGIDEKNVDLITLDMKDAEKVVENAFKSLKPGGWLVVYSPYIEQTIKVLDKLKQMNFTDVKTIEVICREWQHQKYTRPRTVGLMHTGFLTLARKVM